MKNIDLLKNEINSNRNDEYVKQCEYFHKTSEGGYAEGDIFLGLNSKTMRLIADKYFPLVTLEDVRELLNLKYHEYRCIAVVILVNKYKGTKKIKSDLERKKEQEKIVNFYLDNAKSINGWDLVDVSAPGIIGEYVLENKKYDILYNLAVSSNIWEQRIAVVSNITLIRAREFQSILKIVDILLLTKHDLIQKAVGWMLREVGNRDYTLEYEFLKTRYKKMSRTMLRYSIEKFEESTRKKFLKGEI